MTTDEIIAHIEAVASAWRHEEYEHLTRGEAAQAERCHFGAIQAEQLARDIREKVAA